MTLKKEPNRYRALAGAAEAARRSGNAAASQKYSKTLVTVARIEETKTVGADWKPPVLEGWERPLGH